ncbi:Periplasmic (Tat), binds 2(4Fe-4S) [Oleidesulfovibrio alaskensis G20]|jgi:molybdopterin-containing oxidoreductase family iron-sulfur binding subunit|uniref:Periplasmic (Tat), binds 2(4Fe-4S) n=1 Tax=Oleidesulfovibrio alaskensis (strain ATCC BAA-1058 / DSM 17464 / G20) TaxID=207559 RepID=Q30Z25_OLEA2|nr:4Fe-4S dicluster domain-containing protein [Oleidesulfovibrio alaskensis]ABB39071.1 Periplasmic (Tat), binds 2(4Fe-4S) [Oleidesulfovibrio alaskensis G20]MBG0772157.1 4Fe-4S dicluster domain-containing protein [Oleidesulfovibrio alaskensis]MBL3583414.1 4Fe-4S dicluster domain-containing protein [Oleidesulfovibrio alaskensis]
MFDRRRFLKIAGLSALGLGAGSAIGVAEALAAPKKDPYSANAHALHAGRWAMVIDTRKFETPEDFQKLITACHKQHNVPDIPNDQHIMWLWTDKYEHTFPEQANNHLSDEVKERDFLLLCNHCENPPCVRVCPTKATYKRPDGIVAMDYHRCIGCRFCMAGCPYGARSFNYGNPREYLKDITNPAFPTRMRGVVEKCNFCVERLAQGLMPSCVEASEGAIVFGDLNDPDSEVRQVLAENFTIRRKPSLGTQPGVYYII